MTLKVTTINILSDLSLWKYRRELLVKQLVDISPDIIAFQEVALPENPALWVADQLSQAMGSSNRYEVFLRSKTGAWRDQEGIAILSRYPIISRESISLGGQGRVAQKIQIDFNDVPINITNVHLFWQPGHSIERINQINTLMKWMDEPSVTSPVVICGDFNDVPESEAIRLMKNRYKSAYNLIHHVEPAFTYPTRLPVSTMFKLKTILRYASYIRLRPINLKRRVTLDYIFINPRITVLNAHLILDKPHSTRSNVYPSDHLGLYAELKVI